MNYLSDDEIQKEVAIALLLEQDGIRWTLNMVFDDITEIKQDQQNEIIHSVCDKYGATFRSSDNGPKKYFHCYITITAYQLVIKKIVKEIEYKLSNLYNKQVYCSDFIDRSLKRGTYL